MTNLVKTTLTIPPETKAVLEEIASLHPFGYPTKESAVTRYCLEHGIRPEDFLAQLKEKENVSR